MSALYHTSALVLSADVLTSTSSSLTALDTATDDGSTDSGSAISRYVRPLSTASGLVQHLTAAYWAGIMKRVISTQNDEAHATVLYNAAVLQCAADNVTPNDTFRKMDVQSTDTTSSSRTIPLVYELCVWVSPADHNNAHLNCEQQLDQDFSFASFDRIMSTYFHRASVAVESDSATPSAFQLRDCLDTATILRLRSASALIANTVTKDNAHEVLDKIDGAHYVPSQISLMFSFAVDDSLCPHAYALLCQRQAGGTVFLPPTVLDALRLALPKVWSDSNSLKDNTGYNDKYDKLMLSWIENSLSTSLSWARGYLSSTEKLNAFGLYVPVVNSSSPTHDIATLGNTSNIISKRSTVVLWSDAESLITIQLGNDINSSRIDDDVLHISLLCPIPLPGVGTLGVSGPPRCTVGLPRNVTSEEEDRIKRRCISIGELSLTIARVAEKKIDQIVHSRKRQRRVPSSSYFFCCGQLSHLKAFTEASGLIPTDLYSTLAREILQHAFKRHPFSPSQPTHSSEVLPLSLSLEAPIAEDSNREDVLSALSSAYCSVRPLLEFVLLVSSYTSASDSSAVASASTNGSSSKSSSNGAIGRKNILKIISLDCQSRCEPFIVCALYSIADNSRGVGSTSTSTSTSTSVHSESAIEAPLETLLGFIEVEIVRSSIETKETLDTPHTPIDRTRSDSTVADDQISRKTDKINLKVSGISVDFENQIIEMAIFRECFQKKFQAMTGRNPFHAFVNKLVSSISIKTS